MNSNWDVCWVLIKISIKCRLQVDWGFIVSGENELLNRAFNMFCFRHYWDVQTKITTSSFKKTWPSSSLIKLQGQIQDFSRGVAGYPALLNQWCMPLKCCNLRIERSNQNGWPQQNTLLRDLVRTNGPWDKNIRLVFHSRVLLCTSHSQGSLYSHSLL